MRFKNALYKLTHWETWHTLVKYIPISPFWIWYCIRSGSLWFFSAANPALTFGGLEGETKEEMYSQFPEGTFPKSVFIEPGIPFEQVEEIIRNSGLTFPLIAKPNVSLMGYMLRKITTIEALKKYHTFFNQKYVVQQFIPYLLEVGVFYYRMPNSKTGTVSGLLKKTTPFVTGDGKHNIEELIDMHEGVRFKKGALKHRNEKQLKEIPAHGEVCLIADASNRAQGGAMSSIREEIDDKLLAVMDNISLYKNTLFYGRYDIKCKSIEDLKAGRNFFILEFNGSGSGVQQIFGNGYNLFKALAIILKHWQMLYRISHYNLKRQIGRCGFKEGLRILRSANKNNALLKKMDNEFIL